jgi:hypothetical protein
MSQVSIKILKQGTKSRRVLSCCFFTMADAYRNVHMYERNLVWFLGKASKFTDFEIRIYTDDSGKTFALSASSPSNVSVYHYNFPPLKEEIGHIGTFGTLMRFLPMFEDLDTVWISDIDVPGLDKQLSELNTDVYYKTLICYERKVYGRKQTIVADRMIFKHTFPISMLTRFINKLVDGGLSAELVALNQANSHKPPSKVPYGVDELFLNTSVYNYIKRHDLSVIVAKSYLPPTGFYIKAGATRTDLQRVREYYYNLTKTHFKEVKEITKKLIPKLLEEYPCFGELLKELDGLPLNMEKVFKLTGSEL